MKNSDLDDIFSTEVGGWTHKKYDESRKRLKMILGKVGLNKEREERDRRELIK